MKERSPSLRGYFVTGTDTGIGKTTVAAWLLCALRRNGVQAVPMKPVQTGCSVDGTTAFPSDPAFCLRVAGMQADAETGAHICPYRYPLPASPHLAAEQVGARIELDRIVASAQWLMRSYDALVVEGAGGVWVPLNECETLLDLMAQLALPVLIAARPGLGTINHTLLTIQAVRQAGLTVAGVVFVHTQPGEPTPIEVENRKAIAHYGKVRILGRLDYMAGMETGDITESDLMAAAARGGCPDEILLVSG